MRRTVERRGFGPSVKNESMFIYKIRLCYLAAISVPFRMRIVISLAMCDDFSACDAALFLLHPVHSALF